MDRGQTFFQWMEPKYVFHTWSRPEYYFGPKKTSPPPPWESNSRSLASWELGKMLPAVRELWKGLFVICDPGTGPPTNLPLICVTSEITIYFRIWIFGIIGEIQTVHFCYTHFDIWPEAPVVRAKDLIPTLPLLGLWTRESAGASRLKAPSGGVKYPGQVAPTTGPFILVPPDPRRMCSKFVFNLNWWILLQ